ncbi:hypothetical protein B0H21DRAFT_777324 [Amylocystis lapponica]|nr:hypothetical protein B0H21DRAFT_777324 [Amylocystis lapponica]
MMESPQIIPNPPFGSSSSRSRSSTKIVDDVTSLTSFNPFSEEDENDQSSYALVTSLFSKVKSTLAAPLSSAPAPSGSPSPNTALGVSSAELRRPSINHGTSNQSSKSGSERQNPFNVAISIPAPHWPPSRNGSFYSPDTPDGGVYGTAIPGFPIQDSDARSIRTTGSIRRSASVSKVFRRIRGEGLSRDYWMDDALCKECYDCKSVFTAWRRKHHCRICGQVFCSRCASNIIKGARFGHDGMVRICNLCLEKLGKVDDDDDDDRRSVTSNMTSPFAAHQLGAESLFALAHHPQSPFAASQLFGRTDEPFNLFSIAETKGYAGSDDSPFTSRPMSPEDSSLEDRFFREGPAPFRRALAEEEKDPISLSDKFSHDHTPVAPGSKTPVDFPVTIPVSLDGSMSSVQFPVSSPDQAYPFESPGMLRSRFNSYADLDMATPFIRSRVQSRLGESFVSGEPGWRTRRESTAYAQELNLISMFHLRIMLRQMLTAENIPNIGEWEETLLKLALKIARELTFTAHPHRQGADMDVRRYVKIKKIPGGAPRDSEYVDGAVITKNVAHKQMLRTQHNPRIMLVTFPLEFHRVEGQYMHFGQIFRQEKEYLGNLATRIAALRPHVVLAEKSVSRLALDALAKHKVAVARAVKPSAIQFVSRMTQGDVFSSIDKLALEPRLGHCRRFRIQTFDHPLIPGRRKSYMRFEGCNGEMGCTILLRGGDIDILRRIKKVTRFLTFIVRNLRLETHLWKDSVITLPPLTMEAIPAVQSSDSSSPVSGSNPFAPLASMPISIQRLLSQPLENIPEMKSEHISVESSVEDLPDEDAEQVRLSRRIEESLEPYKKTFLSVSATLRFRPPQPIRRMKELDDELIKIKQEWEDEVIRREEKPAAHHEQEETVTPLTVVTTPPDLDDVAAQIESLPLPEPPHTPTPLLDDHPGYFDLGSGSNLIQNGITASPLPRTPMEELPAPVTTVSDIALESRLRAVQGQHAEQRRIWEWYLRKNKDDFDVEKYQCISLWELTLPMTELGFHRACSPPQLKYMTFYGENDCTLGQFIEKSVMDTLVHFLDPKAICENKSCGQPLARHCKVYVHNETRLSVAVEQWDGQIVGRANYLQSPDTIITWSACRLCHSATPFIPISLEMQRYSFAKFLELHFYPADVQLVQGAGCHHNIYQHHIRYFAIKGMTVRFQADPVILHEVVYPPMRTRIRPETQLEIKNGDFERLHSRNNAWYSALIDDLKLITIDAATGEEEVDARLTAEINHLITKAEWEKDDIAKLINQIYKETPPTDTLALNQVRAYRQDKIVAWQQDFDKLPKPRLTQLFDRNSRRPSAFGSVRAIWPRKSELYGALDDKHVPSSSVSEAEDGGLKMRRVTGDSFMSTSSASSASETESVVELAEEFVQSPVAIQPEDNPQALVAVPKPDNQVTENLVVKSPIATEASPKSDPDSDSTIGAGRMDIASPEPSLVPAPVEQNIAEGERTSPLVSRLPRRASVHPSVAELVKKYQDFLPAQGVEELARTAFPPGSHVSESEQESQIMIRPRVKSKVRRQLLTKKASTSDFEQSYAANIAPKYLTHARRPLGATGLGSRIPGPVTSSFDSSQPSRRTSPDKRTASVNLNAEAGSGGGRASSPPSGRTQPAMASAKRRGKGVNRSSFGEKAPAPRPVSAAATKSTFRRQPGPGSKVSNIAKHFERINKDNERASRRYAVIRGKRPRPVASARAKVEVLDSIKDAIRDESESSDSSEADDEGGGDDDEGGGLQGAESKNAQPQSAPLVIVEGEPDLPAAPVVDSPVPPEGPPEVPSLGSPSLEDANRDAPPSAPESPILSAMTHETIPSTPPPPDLDVGPAALSGFWPQQAPYPRHRNDMDGDDPMSDPEHIFRNSSMVVPLNSPQYRDMLSRSRAEKRQTKEPKLTDGGEAFMPDDKSVAESTSTWGVVNVETAEIGDPTEELRVPSSKQPWAISFESGGLTISCTVLFPEQFDALRRTYDCERSMIESLARCVKWDASGGKSGSAFLKTLDDRFIAKELSRAELQAMETFAPAYFDYMSSAVVASRPTLLAKLFGCFKITFRKTHKHQGSSKSKPTQMNLLVMENLFYDRRFSKIYDLKVYWQRNEVLLDENLVETAHLTPFYLREHSKRILRVPRDINVMDYSLVVGVDSVKNELVVGIVDYIRTYTWDKKLESWVKDSAFLGGANKGEPTIIGPRQYRQRFLSAMERYFPLVPDRWMKQHDAPEEDGNSLLDLWPDW